MGKTPQKVIDLLKSEVGRTSIWHVSKSTGIGLAAIGRYLKGIGEPREATLQKLANYFNETFTIEIRPQKGEGHEDNI